MTPQPGVPTLNKLTNFTKGKTTNRTKQTKNRNNSSGGQKSKIKVHGGLVPSRDSEEISITCFSPIFWWLLVILGLWQHNYNPCLSLHTVFFHLSVSKFPSSFFFANINDFY